MSSVDPLPSGATRELTFSSRGLGLVVVREWGHSHFLVKSVKREAAQLGVQVGEALVAIGGKKTRWKTLLQLQEQLRVESRPTVVQFGELRAHGEGVYGSHPEEHQTHHPHPDL